MKKLFATALICVSSMGLFASVQATCFQDFSAAVNDCYERDTWGGQVLCVMDAELTLAGCIRETVIGV